MTQPLQKQNRRCVNCVGEYDQPFVMGKIVGRRSSGTSLRGHHLLEILETGGFDRITLAINTR